jgi:hypothetical protein
MIENDANITPGPTVDETADEDKSKRKSRSMLLRLTRKLRK